MKRMRIKDIRNNYEKGSMKWVLCNKDFSSMTITEIASYFGAKKESTIYAAMRVIRKETGFEVPYKMQ